MCHVHVRAALQIVQQHMSKEQQDLYSDAAIAKMASIINMQWTPERRAKFEQVVAHACASRSLASMLCPASGRRGAERVHHMHVHQMCDTVIFANLLCTASRVVSVGCGRVLRVSARNGQEVYQRLPACPRSSSLSS